MESDMNDRVYPCYLCAVSVMWEFAVPVVFENGIPSFVCMNCVPNINRRSRR